MKDLITKNDSRVKIPTILGTIKERLVEHRFNIDVYDHKEGWLKGRRNSLDKMILGLYRNIEVRINRNEKSGDLGIELIWGGMLFPLILTFLFMFLVSFAIFKGEGTNGILMSIPVGMVFVLINLGLFAIMRGRLISQIKRDLIDLEAEESRRKLR